MTRHLIAAATYGRAESVLTCECGEVVRAPTPYAVQEPWRAHRAAAPRAERLRGRVAETVARQQPRAASTRVKPRVGHVRSDRPAPPPGREPARSGSPSRRDDPPGLTPGPAVE